MKEDWDVKMIKESSAEHLDGIKANPFKNSKYFFGFDINLKSSGVSYSKRSLKKSNGKRIFYYI